MKGAPIRAGAAALALTASVAVAGPNDGDPRKGAELYRACVSCHSLRPGVHLTGPSLAGVIGRTAGTAKGFGRYSPALSEADFEWDETTLAAFLADPQKMFPGTYMTFPGLPDPAARADLVAFLAEATAPGGAEKVVEDGLIPAQFAEGQVPPDLGEPPPEGRVTAMRHCGDSFFITTADGAERPFWEKNVRIKIDSAETGPPAGVPVVIGAGMRGDRVSVIFSNLDELAGFIEEKC